MYFKIVPFPPYSLARSTKWFFFAIHSEDLVELLEIKLTKVWGPLWLAPPGVFNFYTYPHWASHNLSITVRFSCTGNCPGEVLAFYSFDFFFFFFDSACLSLQFLVQWFALWPHESLRDLRTVEFSVYSAFYVLGNTDYDYVPKCQNEKQKCSISIPLAKDVGAFVKHRKVVMSEKFSPTWVWGRGKKGLHLWSICFV